MPDDPQELPLLGVAFKCHECGLVFRLASLDDDPTTSSGCCPLCGGRQWNIYGKYVNGQIVRLV
jgi:Zn finger protein HypA/HybF involved in hydrogenase expression